MVVGKNTMSIFELITERDWKSTETLWFTLCFSPFRFQVFLISAGKNYLPLQLCRDYSASPRPNFEPLAQRTWTRFNSPPRHAGPRFAACLITQQCRHFHTPPPLAPSSITQIIGRALRSHAQQDCLFSVTYLIWEFPTNHLEAHLVIYLISITAAAVIADPIRTT